MESSKQSEDPRATALPSSPTSPGDGVPGTATIPDSRIPVSPSPASPPLGPLAAYRYVAPPPPRKPGPLGSILNLLLWGGIFVGTAAASAVLGAGAVLVMPLPSDLGSGTEGTGLNALWKSGFRYRVSRPVNILVMGLDRALDAPPGTEAAFGGRTDTLLLVRINPEDNTLRVISIPRDTRVNIPGYGIAKINHANVEGGPELVAQTLADNFGQVQIDRYVRVNTAAFQEIVDLVGGIEVEVPREMQYTDQTQGLYIDLRPGWQTLNGDQAEQFARFRSDAAGDIGRVQRQQMLLKALRERLTNPLVVPSLPQVIRVAQRYVDTNLTLEEMLALANFSLEVSTDEFQMVMLPGQFSGPEFEASYWLPDWQASATVLQSFFQTNTVGIYADNTGARYVTQLRIAVQNASNTEGTGAEMVRHLRDSGFSNVYLIDDASHPVRDTEVIAQRGDHNSAAMVQSVLGRGRVLAESTGDLGSDITIRVGQDWDNQGDIPLP